LPASSSDPLIARHEARAWRCRIGTARLIQQAEGSRT
jgi:hypothetical protein